MGLAPARTKVTSRDKESYFREATAVIAAAVDAPVVLMGGNRNTEVMQDILDTTNIKYFSIARPLLSEMVQAEPSSWREAKDLRRQGMSAAMACQEMPGVEQEEYSVFSRDLSGKVPGLMRAPGGSSHRRAIRCSQIRVTTGNICSRGDKHPTYCHHEVSAETTVSSASRGDWMPTS